MPQDKLKLEHLTPYLPYKIKYQKENIKSYLDYHTMAYIDLSGILRDEYNERVILRPLSDLTRDFTLNGIKFNFAKDYLQVSAEEEEQFDIYGTIPDYWEVTIEQLKNGGYKHLEYWIVDKLFALHFDVFKLIDKGLAISYNDINDGIRRKI